MAEANEDDLRERVGFLVGRTAMGIAGVVFAIVVVVLWLG
jgi:hypothetical protein